MKIQKAYDFLDMVVAADSRNSAIDFYVDLTGAHEDDLGDVDEIKELEIDLEKPKQLFNDDTKTLINVDLRETIKKEGLPCMLWYREI